MRYCCFWKVREQRPRASLGHTGSRAGADIREIVYGTRKVRWVEVERFEQDCRRKTVAKLFSSHAEDGTLSTEQAEVLIEDLCALKKPRPNAEILIRIWRDHSGLAGGVTTRISFGEFLQFWDMLVCKVGVGTSARERDPASRGDHLPPATADEDRPVQQDRRLAAVLAVGRTRAAAAEWVLTQR